MVQKRKRRTALQSTGLAAGETLKRSKLTGRDYSTWGWVSEIPDASKISHDHLLRTCGFSQNFPRKFCPNKYAQPVETSPKQPFQVRKVSNGELDDDCIIITEDEALSCDKKSCQSNPHCLNYLGQKGWEQYEDAKAAYFKMANLGQNPILQVREPGHPVGLKNLGATCYANALLQVWFQDLPFRSGVYRCQPSQDAEHKFEESPIFQLQVTFAALQESTQNVFNPVKLVESLKLRTTEQQDAQEFSKLFMSHLDSEFQKQHNPDLKSLVASQFQGKQVYGTICENCKCRSERTSDFLELEVSIDKNSVKLEDRISLSLNPETLTGDNKQAVCIYVSGLQDATRYTEYTEFPPVLHFSLLRFVYDLASMERKKSKHVISFPLHLDMNQFLRPQERSSKEQIYDLRGVLLHKGVSAYHGHYEAQVFDISTACWYQYNDEIVTKIKTLGAKPPDSECVNVDGEDEREGKLKPLLQARRRKKRRIDSDDEAEPTQPRVGPPEYVSSKDAYMLVYVRRNTEDETFLPLNSTSSSNRQLHPVPPVRALRLVQLLNQKHDQRCDEYQKKAKDITEQFDRIRRQVVDIYQTWTVSPPSKSIVVSRKALEACLMRHRTWIPTDGISGNTSHESPDPPGVSTPTNTDVESKHDGTADACNGGELSPTDTSDAFSVCDIICEHGCLDPRKAQDMKCIDIAACEKISSYIGQEISPLLSTDDVCRGCATKIYEEKLYQVEHPRLVSEFEEACNIGQELPGFWISKSWLKDWKSTKPKMHVQGHEDPSPDYAHFASHVRCEHGNLSPNITYRRRITTEATKIVRILFPSWSPLSTEDGLCVLCEALICVSKEGKREIRRQAEDEKARLKHMYENGLSRNTAFLENTPCCIVPTKFIRDWKQWLLKPTEVARPTIVDLKELNCEHNLIALDPNSPSDMDSSVTLITRSDWDILESLYPTGPIIAIERRTAGDGNSSFFHDREVCQECRQRRKADFDSTEVTIRIMRPNDPVPTSEPSICTRRLSDDENDNDVPFKYDSSNGGLRQSKRLRQGKSRKQKKQILVWKHTSVGDIKLKIQEELGIPALYQTLFYRGVELDDKWRSVEDIGLMVNDVLDLRQEVEDLDIFDEDADILPKRPRRDTGVEGFGGTLLGGFSTDSSADDREMDGNDFPPESSSPPAAPVKSCPACTFENPLDEAQCEICAYKFGTE